MTLFRIQGGPIKKSRGAPLGPRESPRSPGYFLRGHGDLRPGYCQRCPKVSKEPLMSSWPIGQEEPPLKGWGDPLKISYCYCLYFQLFTFIFVKSCALLTSPPCSLLFMWSSPLNARHKDNPDKNRRYKTPKILIIICSGSFRLWKSLLWKMWLRGIWLLRSVGFEESETWLVSQFWEFKIDKAGRSKELK